jgi:hypothetical protein
MRRRGDLRDAPLSPQTCGKAPTMLLLTYLPACIITVCRGMPGAWKPQQRLLLCWRMVLQAVYPGRKTLAARHRWSPQGITAWRCKRVLTARYWCVHRLIAWLADDVMATLPPPADGTIAAIGDGSYTNTRARKNPLAYKGRKSHHHPWLFGIRFALLIVAGYVDRLPGAFRLILPKTHPAYRPEHALFRDMLSALKPPAWATLVLVAGDAASGSTANITLVKQLDQADPSRDWHVIVAIARTWKTAGDQAVKNLVQHLPRCRYKRTWIPRLSTWQKRKASWAYATRLCLRDMGDVTVVRSTTGRNVSPAKTKRLVTTLPHVTARQTVWLDQNRWSVAHACTVTCNRRWGWGNTKDAGGTIGLRSHSASPYWPPCLCSECVITRSHRGNRGVCPDSSTACDSGSSPSKSPIRSGGNSHHVVRSRDIFDYPDEVSVLSS